VIDATIAGAAEAVLAACRARRWRLATAESCTGGLVAGALTAIGGSSDVFDCGFVTYSNESKMAMLGVPEAIISLHGAVSEAVARLMAEGALSHSRADLAVAVTGIAGPGGGVPEKPVGLVWFGLAEAGRTVAATHVFAGDRAAIRHAAVQRALALLLRAAAPG